MRLHFCDKDIENFNHLFFGSEVSRAFWTNM